LFSTSQSDSDLVRFQWHDSDEYSETIRAVMWTFSDSK